jgi:hypothetical protein
MQMVNKNTSDFVIKISAAASRGQAYVQEFLNKLRQKYPTVVFNDVIYYPKLTEAISEKYGISNIHTIRSLMNDAFITYAQNGEALRRIGEGAAMIRTKGEAGTGDVVEAVRHARA